MKINLAENNRIYAESGPFKILSEAQLARMSDNNTTSSGIGVEGETLALVCDLGARYNLDKLTYHRTPATTELITFTGKQNEGDVWTVLTASGNGSLTVDLFGPNRYQFLRVHHQATVGSGEAHELEVFSSDSEVLFGDFGGVEEFSVDSGTSTLGVQAIPIYNPSSIDHNFYTLLDPTDPQSEDLRIGTTSGTLFDLYQTGISVPNNYPWSTGQFDNTVVSGTNVVVMPSGFLGTYYTPIIDISGLDGQRFFWKATITGTTEIDDLSSLDNLPTVGVRLSDTAPIDPGWASGQLSTDPNWDLVSGTLSFAPLPNAHILEPRYRSYFQARLEFYSEVDGQTPVLHQIGIEEGHKLLIPLSTSKPVFVKSKLSDHQPNRDAFLISWYFESRNLN